MSTQDLQRFEWSVRALAQDAATQRQLYPSFVCVADELALEFDEYLRALEDELPQLTAAEQIRALDSRLSAMSGPDHAALWTDDALRDAPEWVEVRAAAQAVLQAMGWSSRPPPNERGAVYVGSDA
jgi:hypothetical protein